MPRMVEVVIDSVRVSLTNQQRIVVLREVDTDRYLPIWIGPYEAESITIALQEVEVARPQTHDLLKNVFTTLNARIIRVEVISLKDEVFYGNIVTEVNGHTVEIDSRPSDALALAVRAHVPILVSHEIMDTAGILPEEEKQEPQEPPERRPAPLAPTSPAPSDKKKTPAAKETVDDNLSVFEDFLSNLNIDNLADDSGDKTEGENKDSDQPKPKKP
jgi:bifunctional DNase/RNase